MVETHEFRYCTVIVDHEAQLVTTTFHDGATLIAAPDVARDEMLATELGYTSAWAMCAEHDLTHARLADKEGKVSAVLWAQTHGEVLDNILAGQEERRVLDEQRRLNLGEEAGA